MIIDYKSDTDTSKGWEDCLQMMGKGEKEQGGTHAQIGGQEERTSGRKLMIILIDSNQNQDQKKTQDQDQDADQN